MTETSAASREPDAGAAAKKITGHGGQLAAATLKQLGVDTLFTLSGGHLFSLYDGCVKEDIRLVDVRHEQTATFAAEAWAKVTRRPGVAALTAGPGVTNGVSAMTGARFTGSPMLVLGGRAPQARWGQGSLQELDHVPIVESVTKAAGTCTETGAIPCEIARMLRVACTPQTGPTFLDLPIDVVFGPAEAEIPASSPLTALRGAEPDPERLAGVAARLAAAQRPVLMAGADVYWGRGEAALRELAEEVRSPVFLNGLGRGLLPADHELVFSRARSAAFAQADLLVVIGTPLDFRLRFGQFEAPVVHLMSTEDRVARHVALAAGVGADLRATLEGLAAAVTSCSRCDHEEWISQLSSVERQARDREQEMLTSDQSPIHPARIYGELARRLSRDAIVIGDGGDFVSYAGKLVDTFEPGCFLDPGPFGCLGTGPGYALGAQIAHPQRHVVLMLGDGAAGFSAGDLDTLVRFGLPVLILVGNNVCWGLEKHPMQQLYGYHVAAELSPLMRFDALAQAVGGAGERVEAPGEIGAAIERGLDHRGGPYVVDIRTDPENVYPRSSNLA